MNQYIEKLRQTFRKGGKERTRRREPKSIYRRMFPEKEEGQSPDEYAKKRLLLGLKYGVYMLTFFALLRGVLVTARASISVSNTVNGRELPIYCVETDEPKIALTFDAAWGNEDTKKILEILEKHDVHVTFFMTGGWVVK